MYNNFYPYYNYGFNNSNIFNKLSSLTGKAKINWSNILNNTQKTLSIINQAIPIIYQIKPIYTNAKTIFKVINAVKEPEINIQNSKTEQKTRKQKNTINKNDGLTFFL